MSNDTAARTAAEIVGDLYEASMTKDAVSVFALRINEPGMSRDQFERACSSIKGTWKRIWEAAGRMTVPELLIMGPEMELQSLTGEQLAQHGLMRIPVLIAEQRDRLRREYHNGAMVAHEGWPIIAAGDVAVVGVVDPAARLIAAQSFEPGTMALQGDIEVVSFGQTVYQNGKLHVFPGEKVTVRLSDVTRQPHCQATDPTRCDHPDCPCGQP